MVTNGYSGMKHVTPSDTVTLDTLNPSGTGSLPTGFIVGTAGTLHVKYANGIDDTIPSGKITAGTLYPVSLKKVMDSGTSAADIRVCFD